MVRLAGGWRGHDDPRVARPRPLSDLGGLALREANTRPKVRVLLLLKGVAHERDWGAEGLHDPMRERTRGLYRTQGAY